MKKVFLTIALAAFAFAANAQFVIGGQIEYNTLGGNSNNTNVTAGGTPTEWTMPGENGYWVNYSDLTILPKFGYQLDDNMQVGIKLGVEWDKTVDYSMWTMEYATIKDFEGWEKTTQMDIVIAPYFRYNLMEIGSFNLFCEATLGFRLGLNPTIHNYNVAHTDPTFGTPVAAVDKDLEGYKATTTIIDFRVVPGLNYKFSDNFSADLYLNIAELVFRHKTEKTFNDWNAQAGLPANTPANTDETVYNENRFGFRADITNDNSINSLFSIGFNYHF